MDDRGRIIIYQTEDGLTKIDVSMQDETVWLPLEQMADLFQRDKSTISKHSERLGYKWPSIQNGRYGGCAKFPASLILATGLGLTASPQA